jgi:acyl-coenzyme A thioesterase PaaI-like protein
MPDEESDSARVARARQRAQGSGGGLPYTRALGLEFIEAADGFIKYRLPLQETNLAPDGAMSSGALLTLVDHTGSLAAWMTADFGNPSFFGSTVKTQMDRFVHDIREDVFAEGRALSVQGELINSEVKIFKASGEIVAQGSTIYRIIERQTKD